MESIAHTQSYEIVQDDASFLRATYLHLLGAVVAFVAVEFVFFQTGIGQESTIFIVAGFIIESTQNRGISFHLRLIKTRTFLVGASS